MSVEIGKRYVTITPSTSPCTACLVGVRPLVAAAMSLGLMVGVAWGVLARHVGPIPAICIQLLTAALAAACLWWLWRATR